MSDETEVPEQKEHQPVKQSSGSSGAFLATVIALAAAGASYYLWQQQQAMHKETLELGQRIERLLGVVEDRHTAQLQRIDSQARHRHPDTEEQLGRIETLVQDLRGRLGQERREWAVTEVEYLLRIAGHRLTLEHDKDTALAALREARGALMLQDDATFQTVIRQIDRDIDTLTAVSLPDRASIAAELAALSGQVESWTPLVRRGAPEEQTSAGADAADGQQPAAESDWRSMLGKVWDDIKGLVTIRHDGQAPRPLLEPEQRYFLQQNMQLKLGSARLALLAGNSAAYRDSLGEASTWLQRYFDPSAAAVRDAQSRIEQLAAIELAPGLPALGNSIELLQQAAMQAQPPRQAPAPKAASPAAPAEAGSAALPTEKAEPAGPPPAAMPEAETPDIAEPEATGAGAPMPEQSDAPPEEDREADVPALPAGSGQ